MNQSSHTYDAIKIVLLLAIALLIGYLIVTNIQSRNLGQGGNVSCVKETAPCTYTDPFGTHDGCKVKNTNCSWGYCHDCSGAIVVPGGGVKINSSASGL